MKELEITGFSVVTEKDELIASVDLVSGHIIYIEGYKVVEHTKEEPAMFEKGQVITSQIKDTNIFSGMTFTHPPIPKEYFINLYDDYVRRTGGSLRTEELN